MYKQFFPPPLTPTTPDLHCEHNAFTHHIFPTLVHAAGVTILEELEASPESARNLLVRIFSLTNDEMPSDGERPTLALRDISISLDAIGTAPLVVLTLTPPREAIGAYFIGIVSGASAARTDQGVGYFTLERATARRTVVCEWVSVGGASLRHHNRGIGPKPTRELFVQAIARCLKDEAPSTES